MQPQYYYKKEKCIAHNGFCKYGICSFSGFEVTKEKLFQITEDEYLQCKSGALGIYGKYYDPEELISELYKDREFWVNGGVTFSGGEPLLQFHQVQPVLKKLQEDGISICIETALCVDSDIVKKSISYVNFFYVDIKIADASRMDKIAGGSYNLFLKNLELLHDSDVNVVMRHPVIKEYTDDEENRAEIEKILRKFPRFEYQELEEHHLGDDKYRSLGLLH